MIIKSRVSTFYSLFNLFSNVTKLTMDRNKQLSVRIRPILTAGFIYMRLNEQLTTRYNCPAKLTIESDTYFSYRQKISTKASYCQNPF